MCFNQSILQLYQTHQRLYEKVQAELLIVIDHAISISKHDPLAGSSYIKLPRELRYPRKGLIYIQNIDDIACFKSCLARYLNPADHYPARIKKADKEFPKRLILKT